MPRPAFTLLETIATISLLLLIAVSATSMLGSITEIGLRYRHSLAERSAVRRFADVFRSDVRDSVDMVTSESDWPLDLIGPDSVVEYRWDASSNRLHRLVRSDSSQNARPEILATDVFSFTDRCQPKLVVGPDRLSVILRESERFPGWIVEAPR